MKMERLFKEAWKSEIDSGIYLSKDMKTELIEKVISQEGERTTRGKWIYPMVLTSFVVGVAFLLLISIQNVPFGLMVTSNQQINNEFGLRELIFTEKNYWMLGAIILEIVTVLLFFRVIKNTKRWEAVLLTRIMTKYLTTLPRNLIIQGLICIVIGMGIFYSSLTIIKYLTVFFVMMLNCLVSLWIIRGLDRASCPHCRHQFSRKELFKMTWAPYSLKCIQCNENIYQSQHSKKKSIVFIWLPLVSHYGLGFLGIPFQIMIFSFILVGLFFNFYIINFTTSFSKKDEPLW
ncbi:hypothetical protein [Lysinibacillus sp. SGAir0095]|uniref:hypothetical protein n=1 Tax=Lysinibacillus sp. SGAir0095 TaxID=2070463 RepID=UPI0010CD1C59|nr:hypothetical protein [Lysinibacillus sp. SGAir0095]QCR32861.1 hypothetical protein C1N55_12045 [Lysinibacillus sp. SGAir0095]